MSNENEIIEAMEITEEDYEWFWDTHNREDWECDRCGGEGFIELVDAPELWGEDCLSEENRLIICPGCREIERDIIRIIIKHKKGCDNIA